MKFAKPREGAATPVAAPPRAHDVLAGMALLNFRDVAAGNDARPLRAGRLFRSAQPHHLDQADVDRVRDAGIRTIVDLREPHEQVPPDWAPVQALGVAVVRVPVADQILPSVDEKAPPDGEKTGGSEIDSRSVPEGHRILGGFYRAVVDQAGSRLAEVMVAVAGGGPVLLHCAAGKDRTGTTVALLLDLIGAAPETIVADYLRTNEALDDVMRQLTGASMAQVRARTDIPPGIGDAPESAIRALLRHLESKGGSAAVLLRHTDQATLTRVVAALTE